MIEEQQLNETSTDDLTSGEVVNFEIDPDRTPYNLAADEYTVTVNPYPQLKKPIYTKHIVRKPTFEEEDKRERSMPLITKEAGKVGNADASQTEMDTAPADKALYDKIIKRVHGYKVQGQPIDWLDPQHKVPSVDENGAPVEVPLVDVIPDNHKSLVVNGMYPSMFNIHEDVAIDAFALGAAREWTLRQDIGGKEKQEDGTLSKPDFTILYTFREPTAAELRKFRSSAFAALTWTDKEGVRKERRTVVLSVMRELFDKLLVGLEGATVDRGDVGEQFDVRNRDHLALIPGTFKKGAMLKLFTFLQADLGNSNGA